jgi:hypothetical protein
LGTTAPARVADPADSAGVSVPALLSDGRRDQIGDIEVASPTLEPGETIATTEGHTIQILDVVYLSDAESPFRALLTAEPLADPKF